MIRPGRIAAFVVAWLLTVAGSGPGLVAQVIPQDERTAQSPWSPLEPAAMDSSEPLGATTRLLVKFVDAALVRSTPAGGIASRSGADLGELRDVSLARGLSFSPGIRIGEASLDGLVARARQRAGTPQPDLAGMLEVHVPGADPADLVLAGAALDDLDEVEWVWMFRADVLPAGDIPPYTPDISFLQDYREPDPGMNFTAAAQFGLTGAGVRLSDCEFGWNVAHEDLVDVVIHPEPGQTVDPTVIATGLDQHGTAVLGIVAAAANGYGCTGMAPEAALYTYPVKTVEQGDRALEAITQAIIDSDAGDVVLVELQTSAGAPAETILPIWTVVKTGTAAGVVVVAAAGNGSQGLDSFLWSQYKSFGDSGAIIVGAGSATASHDKLPFSTSGSRVNVQGWGEQVFTLGYGDTWWAYGQDINQAYEADFGGTSAAMAMVGAAAVLLQERARSLYIEPMGPLELRELLVATGIPQGAGVHIGPFVDLAAALAAMPDPWPNIGGSLQGSAGTPALVGQGKLEPLAPIAFTLSSVRPGSACWLVLGSAEQSKPFKGGTLVPTVDFVAGPFLTDPLGQLKLTDTMPAAVSPGQHVYGQFWIADAAGPNGAAASNAIFGVVP